jgi:uncharacterized membrane protein
MKGKTTLVNKIFHIWLVIVFLWIFFALSFDVLMIVLHFFNPELQSQILNKIKL